MAVVEVEVPQYYYFQYPPVVSLETYAYCNGKCIFCNFHTMTRKRGAMSKELLHKVIEEISTWNFPTQITVNPGGEFFLDLRWFDILSYIRRVLPRSKIVITTNGSHVDDDTIDKLVAIPNVDIGFSLYAYYPETYRAVMGLPIETIHKIEHAIERFSKERADMKTNVSCTADSWYLSSGEFNRLVEKWGIRAIPHPMIHNSQHHDYPLPYDHPDCPCNTMFSNMAIYHNGDVGLCCFDANGEVIFGNVNIHSLFDVWNGDKMKMYRNYHMSGLRKTISLCGSCNYGYSALHDAVKMV